ncbi:MAG: HAD hydrolase family protein [Thermoleophilaceae bacterium]|nr:HAD hydrolase family protein [Thermoleophilaceae bacterium]
MTTPLRCVYTDLDGTLLGRAGSLLHDAEGAFSLRGVRALEACQRAGVEVVLKSGRRRAQVMEDARLIGQTAFIYEVGCGLVIDGEETLLTDGFVPANGKTIFDLITDSGAPTLLLETYAGRLEPHAPWHLNRDISHLLRGLVDAQEATDLLSANGHETLRLVDNGAIAPKGSLADLGATPHAYHLMPRAASKAAAVQAHMRARGLTPEECIAVGDSREDLGVAAAVGRFFLVRNGVEKDPTITDGMPSNVEVCEERNGSGFYEAVVRSLAEAR